LADIHDPTPEWSNGPLDLATALRELEALLPDGQAYRFVLVFGTPHGQECVAKMMAELHSKVDRFFVVSGHGGEAQAIVSLANSLGVPKANMVMERLASNTSENVRFSKKLFPAIASEQGIGLLTKDYAMVRAYLTAVKVDLSNCLGPIPCHLPGTTTDKLKSELAKLVPYAERGWIADPALIGLTAALLQRYMSVS
jgi:uncharacterized SAM-binding protein YcdF (DUF218 family)